MPIQLSRPSKKFPLGGQLCYTCFDSNGKFSAAKRRKSFHWNYFFKNPILKKLIGFTPEEWEIICKKAKSARLRTGTYIRRISVKGEIKYYELKELVALKRAFLSIGNNLNQFAKVANESGSVTQKDIEDMQEEFKYFRTTMQSYLFDISPTYIS